MVKTRILFLAEGGDRRSQRLFIQLIQSWAGVWDRGRLLR
jgi:hypothetical protein